MTLSRSIAKLVVEKNVKLEHVVEILRTYKLLALLPSIRSSMVKIHEEKNASSTIEIESPFEVTGDALMRIKRIIGNDLANTNVTINKNILAGFKARFKGKLYDGSAERIMKALIK